MARAESATTAVVGGKRGRLPASDVGRKAAGVRLGVNNAMLRMSVVRNIGLALRRLREGIRSPLASKVKVKPAPGARSAPSAQSGLICRNAPHGNEPSAPSAPTELSDPSARRALLPKIARNSKAKVVAADGAGAASAAAHLQKRTAHANRGRKELRSAGSNTRLVRVRNTPMTLAIRGNRSSAYPRWAQETTHRNSRLQCANRG